jgi:hypothetical protein
LIDLSLRILATAISIALVFLPSSPITVPGLEVLMISLYSFSDLSTSTDERAHSL